MRPIHDRGYKVRPIHDYHAVVVAYIKIIFIIQSCKAAGWSGSRDDGHD